MTESLKSLRPGEPVERSHPWVAPSSTDRRGPCPYLNILANHGILPHDGRVTADECVKALHRMGLSSWIAAMLTTAVRWQFSLAADERFGLDRLQTFVAEHKGSVTRAPHQCAPDPKRLAALGQVAPDRDYLTAADILGFQAEQMDHESAGLLDRVLGIIEWGAVFVSMIGTKIDGAVAIPKSALNRVLAEERLPEGYPVPSTVTGVFDVVGRVVAEGWTMLREK